ncbi:hypothetical protein ACLEW0_20300 [Enterobacter ludwigii]|uniref:hypothetical protein n=1 Tax=Enterobacter ludwigii TaxID=299767 RepID=UPI0039753AC1
MAIKDSLSVEGIGAVPMATESRPEGQDLGELTVPGDDLQSVSRYATDENNYPEKTAGAVRMVVTV